MLGGKGMGEGRNGGLKAALVGGVGRKLDYLKRELRDHEGLGRKSIRGGKLRWGAEMFIKKSQNAVPRDTVCNQGDHDGLNKLRRPQWHPKWNPLRRPAMETTRVSSPKILTLICFLATLTQNQPPK